MTSVTLNATNLLHLFSAGDKKRVDFSDVNRQLAELGSEMASITNEWKDAALALEDIEQTQSA